MPLGFPKDQFAHNDIYMHAGKHSSKYDVVKTCSECLDSGFTEKHSQCTAFLGCLERLKVKQHLALAKWILAKTPTAMEKRHGTTTRPLYKCIVEKYLS